MTQRLLSSSATPRTPPLPLLAPRRRLTRCRSLAALLLLVAAACDRPPSADSLKEWTAGDHHSTDDDKATGGAQVARAARAASSGAPGSDVAQLVDLTWRQQCTTCHGPTGHGDGQMGPMVQAPDLTRGDWQAKMTDAEMAGLIKAGRNRMPSFNLPDPVLAGLVARIRSLGR
jgi:mono/diheme cytochrome c family protein